MALIRFSAISSLTKEELLEVKPITDLAFNSIILFHDYASWEKEDAAFKRGNSPFMLNAIEVLMRVYKIDLFAAKQRLWVETEVMEQKYCSARDEYIETHSPSQAVIHWFGLIELCVAGNAIWSTTTTRYDKSRAAPVLPSLKLQSSVVFQTQAAEAEAMVDPSPETPIEVESHVQTRSEKPAQTSNRLERESRSNDTQV